MKIFAMVLALTLFTGTSIGQPNGKEPNAIGPKTEGLELPADQTVDGEQLVTITAKAGDGKVFTTVRWLVFGISPKSYAIDGMKVIIAVPCAEASIGVFAVGILDGKMTEFCRTVITVKGPTPVAPPPPPPPVMPPVVVPPEKPPEPTKPVTPPVAAAKLFATFIVDVATLSASQASIINSVPLKSYIAEKGHKIFLYDRNAPAVASKGYLPLVAKAGGAPVIIIQGPDGAVLETLALPGDVPQILSALKRHEVAK